VTRLRRALSAPAAGFTLIELLISILLSAMLVGVLSTSLVLGVRGARTTAETLSNSADAQSLASYLPQDIESTHSSGAVTTSGASGCSGDVGTPVLRLEWPGDTGSATPKYSATYFISPNSGGGPVAGDRYQLTRYFCELGGSPLNTPSRTVVARNLASASALAVDKVSDATRLTVAFTDLQTDGSKYKFTIAASYRTLAAVATTTGPTPTPTPSATPAPVTAIAASLTDTTGTAGFYDTITVNLDGVANGTCNTGWSVTGLATGYSVQSTTVAAGGLSVSIAIAAGGTAAANTSSVGLGVTRAKTGTCSLEAVNLSSVVDQAAPVLIAAASTTQGTTRGLMQTGDVLTLTFSEPMTAPAVGATTITETASTGGSANDTLTITGVTPGATSVDTGRAVSADLGNKSYVTSGSATAPGTLAVPAAATSTLTVTVGTPIVGGSNLKVTGGSGGKGTLKLTPTAILTDRATPPNPASSSQYVSSAQIEVF
jgi:type II secretory pathway pseudopilin PulG